MKKKMNDSGKSKLVLTILTAVCVVLIILYPGHFIMSQA